MFIDLKDKDKRTGWIISLSIHAAMLILFFFILAWQAPDPPLPEYGIELNFGLEEAGSGIEQPTVTPTPPTVEEQGEPEEQIEEIEEEVVEEQPEAEPIQETAVEELPDSEQEDSPVETQPEQEEAITDPVEEKTVEEVKPVAEPVKEEPKEEPAVEEKVIDSNALYPGSASQGNKENEAGDAGNPQGAVEQKALYGTKGAGAGGPELELQGWGLGPSNVAKDDSGERGKIVFEIVVDGNGDLIVINTIEKTVSVTVERFYRNEVEKLVFIPKPGNTQPASRNKGTITFYIQSN